MEVLVSGSAGLIGSALVPALQKKGHQVRHLTRSGGASGDAVWWDPAAGEIDADRIEGVDAVVHLAGENIMGRWTDAKKARIRDGRVRGTRLLAETLARLPAPPGVMVSASAAGYYGDRGNETLVEESAPGSGFLADLVVQWEAATAPAGAAGIRVAHLRTGIVLSGDGGIVGKQLLLFKAGLGAPLGNGRQWVSWISLQDEIAAIRHLLEADVAGPVNLVGPAPVTNREFTKALGRAVHRPTLPIAVPGAALRLAVGQFADEGILIGQRLAPTVLQRSGFAFAHDDVDTALRASL